MSMRVELDPRRAFLASMALGAALLVASMGFAQDAVRAKELFEQGMREMPEGNYDKACPAFAESLRLSPLPGTAFTLAVCESRAGRIATAQAQYRDFLKRVEALPAKEQAKQAERALVAKEQIEKLSASIPKLLLRFGSEMPEGTQVKRNGQLVAASEVGVAMPLDPGPYVLSTEAPGVSPWRKTIWIGKGETKEILLYAPGTSEQAAAPWPRQKIAGAALFGFGALGLATGAIMQGLAWGQKEVLDQHCGAAIGETEPKRCDMQGKDAASSLYREHVVGTIALATGTAAIGAGLFLFLTARAQPQRQALSFGLVAADSSRVLVGAQGAF